MAQTGKSVVFIASDLRNGGVSAVSQAFTDAGKVLKWKTQILNGLGDRKVIGKLLKDTIKSQPDGIILGGFDSVDYIETLTAKDSAKIKFVGWHSTSNPGPRKIIESTLGQHVVAVEDVSISRANTEMNSLVRTWNQRYGAAWTHTLAINDIYFDHMKESLEKYDRKDIINIAAGDGSAAAIQRIQNGELSQMITIAEPLQTQGWQLADELNRAFANQKPSGYVSSLIVVSKQYMDSIHSDNIEINSKAKEQYSKIWAAY